MNFIKSEANHSIINVDNIDSIDFENSTTITFQLGGKCKRWSFYSAKDANKIYDKIIEILEVKTIDNIEHITKELK